MDVSYPDRKMHPLVIPEILEHVFKHYPPSSKDAKTIRLVNKTWKETINRKWLPHAAGLPIQVYPNQQTRNAYPRHNKPGPLISEFLQWQAEIEDQFKARYVSLNDWRRRAGGHKIGVLLELDLARQLWLEHGPFLDGITLRRLELEPNGKFAIWTEQSYEHIWFRQERNLLWSDDEFIHEMWNFF